MKKLIILIEFLFLCICAFSQWSSVATNQTITEYNANYAMITTPYLQIKAPLPNALNSKHCLTKNQLIASFYVDTVSNTYLSAKGQFQLVAKRDITNFTFSTYYAHSHSIAFSSNVNACGATLANIAPMYTSSNTAPTIGTTFYSNSSLTTTYGGSSQWWLVLYGTTYYVVQISGVGVVLATYSCATPPSKTF